MSGGRRKKRERERERGEKGRWGWETIGVLIKTTHAYIAIWTMASMGRSQSPPFRRTVHYNVGWIIPTQNRDRPHPLPPTSSQQIVTNFPSIHFLFQGRRRILVRQQQHTLTGHFSLFDRKWHKFWNKLTKLEHIATVYIRNVERCPNLPKFLGKAHLLYLKSIESSWRSYLTKIICKLTNWILLISFSEDNSVWNLSAEGFFENLIYERILGQKEKKLLKDLLIRR